MNPGQRVKSREATVPAEPPAGVMASAGPNDRVLVERIRAGDEAAFTALVEAHHGLLIRVALTFVSSRAVAEEVAQDTWIAVLGGIHDFEGRSSLKTWILRILMNRARTRGKREARSVPMSALERADAEHAVDPARFNARGGWSAPPAPWREETPETLLLDAEVKALIEAEIGRLPGNQGTVVALRDVAGLSSEEVCNVLEISETNQRVLLHRGRSRIRAALERHLERK